MQINPLWKAYNDINNEGGEGFNPHPHFVGESSMPLWVELGEREHKLLRLIGGISDQDPRMAEKLAELALVRAAKADAKARNI